MIITTAVPEEWPAAFELALRHLGPDILPARLVNTLTLLATGAINPEGIFVARDDAGLRGVAVCIPLPGASGLFWLPKTSPADAALEEELIQRALDWLRGRGTKLAQAILSPQDGPYAGALLRRGFRFVTGLQFFEHLLEGKPSNSAYRLRYTTYNAEHRDVFHATMLRTYEDTLDCPELNGTRTMEEIVAGHIGQGNFRPERWLLAWEDDRPVAVALVIEVPDIGAWDLSYVGVVPEARRRGLGREVVEQVLEQAQDSHAQKLILAVDNRNHRALQLYRALGFLSVDFREVYLYFWDRSLDDAVAACRS